MIVSGHFVDIDFKQGIKACFVTDDEQSLYVQTNISNVIEELFNKLKTKYDITSRYCLLELKEIGKPATITFDGEPMGTPNPVQTWYILEAMVFGD